jgi:hypothetical protein
MKLLDQHEADAQWDSLVADLAFIKKHLRYPIGRKTMAPLLMIGIILAIMSRMFAFVFFAAHAHQYIFSHPQVIVVFAILLFCIFIVWYIQLLRFVSIQTPYTLAGNMQLLQQFLSSQNLAFARHPKAPEVFQIMSKNMNEFKGEQREIMIFIADDKRILVNSYFIQKGFSITPTTRHYRQMANRLRNWVKIHH